MASPVSLAGDTIVAVSTPAGASERAIARLSGPEALPIAERLFEPLRPPAPIGSAPNYSAVEGRLHLDGDWPPAPALAYLMRRPASYTREDIVEIHLPGSPPLLRAALDRLLAEGARLAEPGEFTRRAFLNGRIDLAQAEAVMRLIHARSLAEMRVALRQMEGSLSRAVGRIRERTADCLALVEAEIDFSDQDIEIAPAAELAQRIGSVHEEVQRLLAAGEAGGLVTELPRVQLCGPPNAGKSSLFNALARRDEALVTDVPGTTRDLLEAAVHLEGCEVLLTDSAGLTATGDPIEAEAVARARRAARTADLRVLVLDVTKPLERQFPDLAPLLEGGPGGRLVVCLNKVDLPAAFGERDVADALSRWLGEDAPPPATVRTSARTGEGIEALSLAIAGPLLGGGITRSAAHFVLEARHRAEMTAAARALQRAARACLSEGPEFAALELREALDEMGRVLGLDATDDILDRIFRQFCIGK